MLILECQKGSAERVRISGIGKSVGCEPMWSAVAVVGETGRVGVVA